jgi:hypothetical protein
MKHILPLVFLIFAVLFPVCAQEAVLPTDPLDSTKTYQIELVDGTEFIGTILSRDSTMLEIKTSSIPKIQIYLETIKRMKTVDTKIQFGGATGTPNPHYSRYFFAPSAFNLKKGERYYQNTYLVLNSLNWGLTDHFSLGVSLELTSTFGVMNGNWSPIYLITPKYGFGLAKNLNAAFGALIVGTGAQTEGVQLGYGLLTYGNTENNITLGASLGWINGETMKSPPMTLSAMKRIGRKASFITENWIVPKLGSLYSYGVRFFGSKIAVDLGFVNNSDIMDIMLIGIPYVDFTVKF